MPVTTSPPKTSSLKPEKVVDFKTNSAPRPYVNSFVRFHHTFTVKERLEAALKAGWNVFRFPSEMLQGGDLLSDSGTTTLTVEQLSAMLLGDEAYGSNWGYFKILEQFEQTFGIDQSEWEIFLFHQGRAAEHALFSHLPSDGLIPSNGHFDTTRANIETNGMEARDLFCTTDQNFKGNIDIAALEQLLEKDSKQVPLVLATITNNTGGGQPVSLANLRSIRALCDKHGLPLLLDSCRFAENAWFIQQREESGREILDIVHEQFSLCDGFTISLKKDGLANMGGALVIKKKSPLTEKHPDLLNAIRDHQILTEGHPTYGGLTGRDILTIVEGLKTVVTEQYLCGRVQQVQGFGQMLKEAGIPVVEPFGAHAIYIDIDRFFDGTKLRREDFGGIALTGLLLLKGIRLAELGAFAFGKIDPKTGRETFPPQNFVRAAIPRNKYEKQDLIYVTECLKGLFDRRDRIPQAVPVYGRELSLRHFKARFRLK